MEQVYLMPGQERCEQVKDANGISRSVEEAQRRCEDWLVTQDRCYRN